MSVVEIPTPPPEKGTIEMVNLLGEMLDTMVDSIPFTFTTGDLMSALIYSIIDAGLRAGTPHDQLRADLIKAIDAVIPDVARQIDERKRGLN